MAAKSWVGHSEPAAGLMGLAHAQMALQHQMQLPILHLGHLNPHVASALQQGSASGHLQIMRQHACLPSTNRHSDGGNGSTGLKCGVCAFAFQGTNAHAIIEQAGPQYNEGQLKQSMGGLKFALQWQQQKHWIAPPAQALLTGRWFCIILL